MIISKADLVDLDAMVALSYEKRRAYEKVQPQFWRYAGKSAERKQKKWFRSLLSTDEYIILTAKSASIEGFIIGCLQSAPEVYNPGGLTLIIDDFCVKDNRWTSTGKMLIEQCKILAKKKGAQQVIIVSGAHDKAKSDFIRQMGLRVASEWYVGTI